MLKTYNMKKIILFFVLSSLSMFSQDVKDKIAKETCECSKKFDLDTMNSSDLEVKFGLCMLESYNNHINEFSENEKLNFNDGTQMEKFGEQIAMKMLSFCPDIILKLGEGYDEIEKGNTQDAVISGNYVGNDIDTFYNIIIKESNGETTKLIILDYFDNVNLITDKLLKNNDGVNVSYYETQLFDAKLNKFITAKIVTDITKK